MTDKEGKIEVNLVPILATLEALAKDAETIERLNVCHHGLVIPRNYPADFLEAAKSAADYVTNLPEDNQDLKLINRSRVLKGYELLRSGRISINYIGPKSKVA